MHDDLPVGLLELAARVDEGKPIDWDAEERAAADDDARAVIQGFRVLARRGRRRAGRLGRGGRDAAVVAHRRRRPERQGLGPAAPRGSGRPRRVLAGLSGHRSARPARRGEAAGAAPRRRRSVRRGSSTKAACSPASSIRTSSSCTARTSTTAASACGWSSCAGGRWPPRSTRAARTAPTRRSSSAGRCAARSPPSTPRGSSTATSRRTT